jgi:putative tricarboxylic transport membrane protein
MRIVEHRTATRFLFVPFAGGGDMIKAAMAGTVDVVFDSLGPAAGRVEVGAMRLLAVAAAERIPRLADVPTAREWGLDVLHSLPTGFVAPRGLPPPVREAYEDAILRAADDPEHDRLLARLDLAAWRRNGAEYEAHVRELFQTLPPLLRELGMLRG